MMDAALTTTRLRLYFGRKKLFAAIAELEGEAPELRDEEDDARKLTQEPEKA
jgi:hypothetical protein